MDQTEIAVVPEARWPTLRFEIVPDRDRARSLAQAAFSYGDDDPAVPYRLARKLGFRLRQETFGKASTLEALLIPHHAGIHPTSPFTVCYRANLTPHQQVAAQELTTTQQELMRRLAIEFRIGHELGHTFFYYWSPKNGRVAPKRVPQYEGRGYSVGQTPEERFCNRFSCELLAINRSDSELELLRLVTQEYESAGFI